VKKKKTEQKGEKTKEIIQKRRRENWLEKQKLREQKKKKRGRRQKGNQKQRLRQQQAPADFRPKRLQTKLFSFPPFTFNYPPLVASVREQVTHACR
jgi:hypothetical protein